MNDLCQFPTPLWVAETKVGRPPLRYHGGKWRLAEWIIRHMPPHRIYIEPFGGGGSVLMRKPRAYADAQRQKDFLR